MSAVSRLAARSRACRVSHICLQQLNALTSAFPGIKTWRLYSKSEKLFHRCDVALSSEASTHRRNVGLASWSRTEQANTIFSAVLDSTNMFWSYLKRGNRPFSGSDVGGVVLTTAAATDKCMEQSLWEVTSRSAGQKVLEFYGTGRFVAVFTITPFGMPDESSPHR
jgi:hypothetical protein